MDKKETFLSNKFELLDALPEIPEITISSEPHRWIDESLAFCVVIFVGLVFSE